MKTFALVALVASSCLAGPGVAAASELIARFGPAATGNGGPNPLGIPPGAADIELSYVTDGKTEINLSVVPGLFVGKRYEKSQFYASGGGGLVITGNGTALGGYAAVGFEQGDTIKFNADFKQALGLSGAGLISSYALRVGAAYVF
jgi:hypothetical protein